MVKIKIIVALMIAALFVGIHLIEPKFLPEIFDLLSRGDIVETANYIRGYGSMAIVFSFLLTMFVNAIGFPPAIIFSTANTLIFGIVPGIILSVIAETIGVTISFQLLRFFFRDSAKKFIAKHKMLTSVDKYSSRNGFTVMLIARVVPYIPSGILNAAGALSSITLFDYFLSSLIGKFPSTSIEAIIGHDAILQEQDITRIVIAVILAIVLIFWAWRYQKKNSRG
ncbi:MAG: TVP38/TMEM64 family protein [Selenomonadaceae bacterium]|nr:TVP38/TMEM64 family protein [Selenomonadaceae bacterium]